ncbi:unnamed protein product [Camellia sinensis]
MDLISWVMCWALSDGLGFNLSNNQLNGSIPESFSNLPSLQKLSLENNFLTGPVPASIWQNMSFRAKARLLLDLRNNSLSNILGVLNPPENVTLSQLFFRLQGNPICSFANIRNIDQFCGPGAGGDDIPVKSTNSTVICPIHACPIDDNFDYIPVSPLPCFCASPIRIEYWLKSPSFSYFPPYVYPFEMYLTSSLNLDLYQLSIESVIWEKGPRLRMYLKLFPTVNNGHSSTFNISEILRIRGIFTSWEFPGTDLFGPYELLSFTLVGPYSYVNFETGGKTISKGILIAIVLAAVACAVTTSTVMSIKIDGVKSFTLEEMALAADNFNRSSQVGQGGYGEVYRGILSDNTVVAIKRAKEGSFQGKKEFLTEIEMLSRIHHRNLVSLVGYCGKEGEHTLVLLFMLFLVVLNGYATAESETESLPRLRAAPFRNTGGSVIDGIGTEDVLISDSDTNGLDERKVGSGRVSVSAVAFLTLAMAAATNLGAIPFFFVELDPQWAGICNGMAAGVMLAASFDFIQEGQEHGSGNWVVFGILTGGIFIWLCKKFLEQYGEVSMLDIKGADATKAILLVGIMTLHSFGEGSGVGVSFAGSKGLSQGLLVTLAIVVRNIPEGLAVSMVLASRGVSPQNAMLCSVIKSLPQVIIYTGCMIWMVIDEVLPDGLKI